MEENAFRENDLPDRLLEVLWPRRGAADPVSACESVRDGLRERLRLLCKLLPAAKCLAEACGAGNRSTARSLTQEGSAETYDTPCIPNKTNGSGAVIQDTRAKEGTPHIPSDRDGLTATRCKGNAPATPRAAGAPGEDRDRDECSTILLEKLLEKVLTRLTTVSDRGHANPSLANAGGPDRHGNPSAEPAGKENSPFPIRSTRDGSDTLLLAKLAEWLLARLDGMLDKQASVPLAKYAQEDSYPENKSANTFQRASGSTEHVRVEERAGDIVPGKLTALFLARLSAGADAHTASTVDKGQTCRSGKNSVEFADGEDASGARGHAKENTGPSAFERLVEAMLAGPTDKVPVSSPANPPLGTCRVEKSPTELSGKGSPDAEVPSAKEDSFDTPHAEGGAVETQGAATSCSATKDSTDALFAAITPEGIGGTGGGCGTIPLPILVQRLLVRLDEMADEMVEGATLSSSPAPGSVPYTTETYNTRTDSVPHTYDKPATTRGAATRSSSPDDTAQGPSPAATCTNETGNTHSDPGPSTFAILAQRLLARLEERADASAAPSPEDGYAAGFSPKNDRADIDSTEPATLFRTEPDAARSRHAGEAPAEVPDPGNAAAASLHPASPPDHGQDMAELTALPDRFLLLQTLKNLMR